MSQRNFELPFAKHVLQGDSHQVGCQTIVLHGAGKSSRTRFTRLRQAIETRGLPSASMSAHTAI